MDPPSSSRPRRNCPYFAWSVCGCGPIAGVEVALGVSIGIASREDDEGLDQLLHQADVAMYAAKAGGQDRWMVFTPTLDVDILVTRTLRTELQRPSTRMSSSSTTSRS